MPEPDADGDYPALDALRVYVAPQEHSRPLGLGMTQADLAGRADIRPGTLNRIENSTPSIAPVEKICRPLQTAGTLTDSVSARKRQV